MSQKIVKNETLVASPRLPDVTSQSHEHHPRRQSTSWTDAQTVHGPTASKIESTESFNMAHGLGTKLGDTSTGLGGFTQRDGLSDAEHWGCFSPRSSQAQPHGLQNFSFNSTSVSLDTRVSASPLPESLRSSISDPLRGPFPESFQNALHGLGPDVRVAPGHNIDATDGMLRPFGNAREEGMWVKTFDEFSCNKPLGLHLPYPLIGGASTSLPSSLTPTNTRPLQENAYLYHQQPCSSIFSNRHSHAFPESEMTSTFLNPGQLSPPPTASTASTSSGSSSPFTRDVFDNTTPNDGTWKHLDTNGYPCAPTHSDQFSYKSAQTISRQTQDWNADTCDPRGIIGEHEREECRTYGSPYKEALIPMPSHSPALSDMSGSSASGDYGEAAGGSCRGRPRRPDFGTGMSPYGSVPMTSKDVVSGTGVRTGVVYRVRKKSGGAGAEDEMLGMGLEDVDERALEFTSRQDTKPTRMLRRQCFNCRTWRDVSAWRRSIMQVGHIVCNKCGLYEKAHKKSRPLNDRGEFVRPGKHATKASTVRGRGRVRAPSDDAAALGVGVMRFDTNVPTNME